MDGAKSLKLGLSLVFTGTPVLTVMVKSIITSSPSPKMLLKSLKANFPSVRIARVLVVRIDIRGEAPGAVVKPCTMHQAPETQHPVSQRAIWRTCPVAELR